MNIKGVRQKTMLIILALCVVSASVMIAIVENRVVSSEKSLTVKTVEAAGEEIAQWIETYKLFVATLANT
ncbi:MAG: hypothetical protein LBQ52_02095, partial [Helicobacteraceae bacterium]|nr:hypothetical protein [Helicobacteraceae bacterium]